MAIARRAASSCRPLYRFDVCQAGIEHADVRNDTGRPPIRCQAQRNCVRRRTSDIRLEDRNSLPDLTIVIRPRYQSRGGNASVGAALSRGRGTMSTGSALKCVPGAVAALTVGLVAATAVPAAADFSVSLPQDRGALFSSAAADDLVAHYPFDETSGTVVNDRSGNGRHAEIVNGNANTVWSDGRGLTLPGGNGGSAPAVRLPDSLLSGLTDVTIAYDIRLSSSTQQGPVFAFGRTADNGGYLTATPGAGTTRHTASLAGPGANPAPHTVGGPVALAANTWIHVAVTIKGGDSATPGRMVLFENGVQVDANTQITLKPGDITSAMGFIGRSSTATGQQFRGRIKDFRVYAKELTASEVLALSNDLAPGNLAELKDSLDLGDTGAVTKDLALPSPPGVTWRSSDPTVVTDQGVVTRPAAGQGDAHATLTATVTHRGLTDTKAFPITVSQRVTIPAEQLATGLVHFYRLDETAGTTLADSGSAGPAGNATLVNPDRASLTGAGIALNPDAYADSVAGAYVDLPDNLTAGMTEMSVDYDVRIDPANVGDHHLWSFGRKTACEATTNGSYAGSIFGSNTMRIRTGLSATTPTTGASVQKSMTYGLREGVWKHLTYTQQLNANGTTWTGVLYEDGVEIGRNANLTVPPSVNAAGTNCNYLGRSQSPTHYALRGTLRNFRIYDRPLSADEAIALAQAPGVAGVNDDAAAIDLGLTTAIVEDIDLPSVGTKAGSRITWTTSDPSVVTADGVITRPALGQPAAGATLTARLTKGHEVTTRSIAITVPAQFDDVQSVARDTADLALVGLDDIRGNITLPATGRFGSAITWAASAPIVTPTGEVSRPAYGHPDVPLTLTATITKGAASQTKSFPATVKAMPRSEDPERYFLGYFTGEGLADGEQLRFGLSTGNSALDWVGLGGGRPSLVSQLGDQGLRDPFIIRSPDGDTFYMIATDLNWFNRNRDYLINDTQYIEVFESHDLVNWSPQRHVKVAPDNAGNAFAPEAFWDDSIGAYVVFWAQAMWQDTVNRTNPGNQQMWYTTTRDFRTFTPPAVWQDPYPLSRIDTTVIKVGDWYYRFTKNEAGNAGSDVFSEKHTNLRDTNLANWTPVAPSIGRSTWVANQGYEGPIVFKANPGDTACPGQFYFWADRYTNGGGYQLSCSPDIEAPAWSAKTPRFTSTGTVRHGTVTPLSLREWNRIQGIDNPDVTTTTELAVPASTVKEGDAITATVRAADGYEVGGRVRFSAAGWERTVYLEDGLASVTLPGTLDPGVQTLTAEYLGHDILAASEDSESVTVLRTRVSADVPVGGSVPATLSLALGDPATFSPFTPGVAQTYAASTTANVISSAGDARLSVADPSPNATGRLVNGSFALATPLSVRASSAEGTGGLFASVGGSGSPTSLLTYDGPVSNDLVTVTFQQAIGSTEALRTGTYGKTLTFTLSTTAP
ncbi:MAG TPA: immunoglobulin-like domain-containing protein [Solirubrobacter sp.]|nr:immunoglobulin-like domain-containing protein [Solirubrobacter sp.]